MVLNCAAFLLSLAWGLLIFTLSWVRWQSGSNGTQVTPLQSSFLPGFAVAGNSALSSLSLAAYVCHCFTVLFAIPTCGCHPNSNGHCVK